MRASIFAVCSGSSSSLIRNPAPRQEIAETFFRRGFYVRGANATVELSGNSVMDYGKAHFK
jgi:hypothetical protein